MFESYLRKQGIRHEKTIPRVPEQNGVAERMNRTLVETIRPMIYDSKLQKSYWAEAVTTAVYLRNRSPISTLVNMTPFEALFKKKPSVKHLKVFGSECYAHIPKEIRQKLDAKASKCIFLGYGEDTKAYRLSEVGTKKVIFSRDVRFNEDERSQDEETSENIIEIDIPATEESVTNRSDESSDDESSNDETTLLMILLYQGYLQESGGEQTDMETGQLMESIRLYPSLVKENQGLLKRLFKVNNLFTGKLRWKKR